MNFLSELFDFIFAPAGTFDSDSRTGNSDSDFGSDDESAIVNPAGGLPMVGGIGGLDIAGNPFDVDLSHHDEPIGCDHSSMFNDDGYGSGFDFSASMFEDNTMVDAGSMFDTSSMFD